MAERITRAEFARRQGVDRATVTRWINQGRISPPGSDGRLDAEQAQHERLLTESPLPKHQGAKAWHANAKAQRQSAAANAADSATASDSTAPPTTAPSATHNPPPATPQADGHSDTTNAASGPTSALITKQQDISAALKLETWRLQKAKAEHANLQLDRDAGLLVERGIVEYLLRDLGETVRSELTSFPDLHAPQLASARANSAELHKQLADAIHATLERLADAFQRSTEAHLPAIQPPRGTPE